MHVRVEVTLTMGPFGSTGTCIINYTPPEINIVVMVKALFVCCHNVNITSQCCTTYQVSDCKLIYRMALESSTNANKYPHLK